MVFARTALENRVQGDALENAYDTLQELKNVGAEIDVFGNVTLYHYTNHRDGTKIWENKYMKPQLNAVYFSTNGNKNSYASGYGEYVLRFHIPVEKLVLYDIFKNEAHVYIPLYGKKILFVKDYLCTVHRM